MQCELFESCRKSIYNTALRILQKVAKSQKVNSIPVRVTTSTAHIWLNKADCELFFLPIFRFVRYLSANRMLAQFAQKRRMDAPQLRRTGAI